MSSTAVPKAAKGLRALSRQAAGLRQRHDRPHFRLPAAGHQILMEPHLIIW
jgi:hypothetical protein